MAALLEVTGQIPGYQQKKEGSIILGKNVRSEQQRALAVGATS